MKYDILRTQPTKEKPYIINDYPYGFKKTIMKVWVESNKKGDRILRQTQNPKTKVWNKPKASTYDEVKVLGIDKETGYIETAISLRAYSEEEFNKNVEIVEENVNLNEFQKKMIRGLKMAFKMNNAKKIAMKKAEIKSEFHTQRFRHKITGEIIESVPFYNMNEYEEYNGTPEDLKQKEEQKAKFLKFYEEELLKIGVKRK